MAKETLLQLAKALGIPYISKYKYNVVNKTTGAQLGWTGKFKNFNDCNNWAIKWLEYHTARGHNLKRVRLYPDMDKLRARIAVRVLLLKHESMLAVRLLHYEHQEIELALELNRR